MACGEESKLTLQVYLTPADILGDKIYYCPIENCGTTFQNASHLQMHITRHHKTPVPEVLRMTNSIAKDKQKRFYCPSADCSYYQTPSESSNGARNFSSFRSLKQHYLKVHGERKFSCTRCEKSFATASYLRHHRLSCGETFQCVHCSYSYGSREALLTHAKRKQHGYSDLRSSRKKVKSCNSGTQTMIVGTADRQTQTIAHLPNYDTTGFMPPVTIAPYRTNNDGPLNDGCDPGDLIYTNPQSNPIDSTESVVVCTETQTDFMDVMYPNVINQHYPLLSYTHMYTQTYDEPGLFADLGLSTIETQTSWNDGGDGFGDYLVSTETQTNFDIDSFSSDSPCNEKTDQAVQCQQTQLPYLQQTSDVSSETDFLSVINDSICHASNNSQRS